MMKRRVPPGMEHLNQQRMMAMPPQPPQVMNADPGPPRPVASMYPGGPPMPQPHLRLVPPQMAPHPSHLLIPHPGTMIPISSASGPNLNQQPSTMMGPPPPDGGPQGQGGPQMAPPPPQYMPQAPPYLMAQTFQQTYFDDSAPLADPFVPPSYAPEMKNAVVLQPL